MIARRKHPFPSRTRKLSFSAPMVVRGRPLARVGRRRALIFRSSSVVEQSAVNRLVVGSNPTCGVTFIHASIAQLVEHFHGKEGVSGSSPLGSFKLYERKI